MDQSQVYLLNGARTPFGAFGGGLANETATKLGVVAAKEALRRANVQPADVDNVVFGNVIQSHQGSQYLSRHIALDVGIPAEVPALTVNRLCGSGMQAVITAAKDILCGESDVSLAGGAESMSLTPYLLRGARFGMRMGDGKAVDMLQEVLTDCRGDIPMGMTAENLATDYGISREAQDAFAALSQSRASAARASGRFAQEIVPVSVKGRKGEVTITEDEHLRPDTTVDTLAKLRPVFLKDGTVTAGNASGINDGAAALVIASGRAAEAHNWAPIARIVSWGISGVEPSRMGIGPVPAIRIALAKANLTPEHIHLWEVNEAFAAQYLSVEKELDLPRDRTNVNGGAIALGHPVGASGARVLLSLAYELKLRSQRFGVASLCIGGGQGIAMVIEAM
jgi:acetyl-CoA acyltransferase 2